MTQTPTSEPAPEPSPEPAPGPSSAVSAPQSSGVGGAIAFAAAAAILIGAVAVAFVVARSPREPAASTAAGASAKTAASRSAAATPSAVDAAPPRVTGPKWTGGVERSGRKTHSIYYELEAENEVSMFTRTVRPVLSVRCVSGRTEAYVLTESAAVIEAEKGTHTVTIAFDGGSAETQKWFASDDYQALFSPEAAAFAKRIARAQRLRFGFMPYNGPPANVEFDVRGFDVVIGHVAKSCRWKV